MTTSPARRDQHRRRVRPSIVTGVRARSLDKKTICGASGGQKAAGVEISGGDMSRLVWRENVAYSPQKLINLLQWEFITIQFLTA